MEQITISLSSEHRAFVEEQVVLGGHPDASAFLATLIDAGARAQTQLEALLLAGLEGPSVSWTSGDTERPIQVARTGNKLGRRQ